MNSIFESRTIQSGVHFGELGWAGQVTGSIHVVVVTGR